MVAPAFLQSTDLNPAPTRRPRPLTPAERGIMAAAVYADVFDFALTRDELFERIVQTPLHRTAFDSSLRGLTGELLQDSGTFVFLPGRQRLVRVRAERTDRGDQLWAHARRIGRWLRLVPFVRCVAVSGSLAVGNAGKKCDLDLFCITAKNRLWISRLFFVAISKASRLFPRIFPTYVCPNYVLDEGSLSVDERNLFTSHEILQTVPLWGIDVHRDFLRANAWTSTFLPNMRVKAPVRAISGVPSTATEPPFATRLAEKLLSGRVGDRIHTLIYRAFRHFYRRRARRLGWDWTRLASAYQMGRFTVPEGGYVEVVARLFRERLKAIGTDVPAEYVDALLPPPKDAAPVYDWSAFFEEDYGLTA